MLNEVLEMPLNEIYKHGIERLRALLSKEPVGYETLEDLAGIIGILAALANEKRAYYFGRYKETEGDRFEEHMSSAKIKDIVEYLRNIKAIEPDDVLTIEERKGKVESRITSSEDSRSKLDPFVLKLYMVASGIVSFPGEENVLDEYVAIHRRRGISHIVSRRFVRTRGPYFGYRIVERSEAISMLKRAFEARLKRLYDRFKASRIALTDEGKEILNMLYERVTLGKGVGELKVEGTKLYERVDLRPPCMQAIYLKLKSSGHLTHPMRFQLGTFLKRAGMDVEEQKRFRYENAVDNINVSREDFEKHAGYIIEHVYGLRGSGKDYNTPSCERARSGDYYCPFAKEDPESLRELLRDLKVKEERIDKIVEAASTKDKAGYMRACMLFFEATIGKKPFKSRRNPTGYLYRAARAAGLIKGKDKKKNEGSSEGARWGIRGSVSGGGGGVDSVS